jgi:hypothetical protein
VLREQLEHVIRACAQIADDNDIVIVGSQAVLGAHPEAPPTMLFSVEADVYPRNRPERADLIDGAIGEGSPFHATFEYYAHGVGPETAKAPRGWEERLVPLKNENTRGATGWCMEVHDLVLAKCVADRDKDWAFAAEAISHGLVSPEELRARTELLPLEAQHRQELALRLDALLTRSTEDAES